jgi:hypothetical protein
MKYSIVVTPSNVRNLLSCQALISTPRSDGLVHRLIALPLLLPSKRGRETEAVARLLRRRLDIHGATRCTLRSGDAPRLLAVIGLVSAGALVTQTHSEQPSGAPPLLERRSGAPPVSAPVCWLRMVLLWPPIFQRIATRPLSKVTFADRGRYSAISQA